MWKAKALIVLETMDYGMLDIVNKGPHVPMYQPMKDGVADGPKKPTEKHQFSEEDRRLVMLDVRARAAIGNSLPYNIYHLVQNAASAKDMLDALTVAYEGTEEVTETQKNNLNRKYEHFFALKNESLTDTFNRFNCLNNDMQRLNIVKHRNTLVLKFLDSLGQEWEHHVDVLKNSEKIHNMDLNALYGNLRNFEETKALRKEIMRDSVKPERSLALVSKKQASTASDNDSSSDSDDSITEEDAAKAALIVKQFKKREGRKPDFSRFQSTSGYKKFNADKRTTSDKRSEGKCFNCGGADHFARDCKEKKETREEYYERKYKKLMAAVKELNFDPKSLMAQEEEWVEEDSSSDEEVKVKIDKSLIVLVDVNEEGLKSTFAADLDQAASDSKMENWDSSSLYQVKNFASYSVHQKINMFDCLRIDLSLSNQKNQTLKDEIIQLKHELKQTANELHLSKLECRNFSLANDSLHKEKDQAVLTASNIQSIINNWSHSHHKLNKIIDAQIPEQCEKILGGNIDKAVEIFKEIEKESNFPSPAELVKDFENKFVCNSFINQSLIDKHCKVNVEGKTVCTTTISAIDPTIKPYDHMYADPTTETLLKFPISNGEFHSVHETLSRFPDCTVSEHDTVHSPVSSDTDESNCSSSCCFTDHSSYTTDHSPPSRTKDRVYKLNELSSPWKPKFRKSTHAVNKKNHGIKLCYRCGDSSHKADECSFDVNSKRVDNIKIRNDRWTKKENSLNCLPAACYNIFNALSSVKRPIERWVSEF